MTKSRLKIPADKFRTVLTVKVLLVLMVVFSSFHNKPKVLFSEKGFVFVTKDSIKIEIIALFDSDSVLTGYKSLVFSPVCEDTTCYPVELYFYWDIFGNYLKYELPEGVELTKIYHKSFSENDYKKLSVLLQNTNPSFLGMSKHELIGEVENGSIDGYSGATVAVLKDEIIEGAVYSCYTLWHIAHGDVVHKIRNKTKELLTPALVDKIVATHNSENYYFLINSFREEDFIKYSGQVVSMIRYSKGYLAQKALAKLPDRMVADEQFQNEMVTIYPDLDYYAQKSFLKRLDGKLRSNNLGIVLLQNIQAVNSAHTKSLVAIFCNENQKLKSDVTELFILELLNKNISISRQQYKIIVRLAGNKQIPQKQLNRLKQNIE